MRLRKAFVITLVISLVFGPMATANPSTTNYESFLSTPQGRDLLKQAQAGEKIDVSEAVQTESFKSDFKKEEKHEVEEMFSKTALAEDLPAISFYGYEAFKETVATFVPDLSSPVPSDYVIGPGDTFNVTLWGISEGIFKVSVNHEGEITLPKVGVVSVAGLRYGDLKSYIEKQLGRYYEQINVNISMAKIKTIRVYVVGEVRQPGSYTISSLSTLYSALFQAGGPSKHGTLRNIKLIRGGKTVAVADLYKFLLYGKKSEDRELLSGDTIFVPPRGEVVGITGNVNRPAIYEIKGKADLTDLINVAGGFTPVSYLNRVQIERVVAHQRKIVLDRNVSALDDRSRIILQDMDLVKVYPIIADIENVVYLEGNFKYVGPHEFRPGMHLNDIVKSKDILKPYSYLPKAEVVRLDAATLKTKIFDVDLEKLFDGDQTQNLALEAGDKIFISSEFQPQAKIVLSGQFKLPGTYTIRKGERLSSLIERSGGFKDDAYMFGAVFARKSAKVAQETALTRYVDELRRKILEEEAEISTSGMSAERIEHQQIALAKSREMLENFETAAFVEGRVIIDLHDGQLVGSIDDVELEDGDELYVPAYPNIVSVLGEVYSPSSVIFSGSKRISYYLGKVGGLTKRADAGDIYVVRADGSVLSGRATFRKEILPGDIIFVPQIIERFDWWGAVGDFTHWFYEAALAFAVIATYLQN